MYMSSYSFKVDNNGNTRWWRTREGYILYVVLSRYHEILFKHLCTKLAWLVFWYVYFGKGTFFFWTHIVVIKT